MVKNEPLEYSKKRLEQVIALNAQGVSVPGLINAFGIRDETTEARLRADVQTLLQEGFAFKDKKEILIAKKPLSDLVIARVSRSLTNRETKFQLEIQGVGGDFPFRATLSGKQLKKFPGMTLREGDTVAVVLDRISVMDLKARLHGKFKYNKKLTIAGKFNQTAGSATFRPYDNGISTVFHIHGQTPENINRKASYNAAIPHDMDPYEPSLEAIEQKWDPETGASIALIIADKHGVKKYPEKEAYIEAKAALRQPPPFYGRRDLRHEKISVVDPKNAADHDDGILVERTKDGYRTLVVIADVPFYVRPDTALDKSARERGFSHYFPDDTIHMLPQTLTKGASLLQGQLRPVVYVEKYWDEHGREIRDSREVGLGIIQSQMQFTYAAFEDMMEENNLLTLDYKSFGDIITERMRFSREMLMFEENIQNDSAPRAKSLVAAMMIDANIAVAEFLKDNDIPFLNRVHGGMSDELLLKEAADQLEAWGYDVPDSAMLMDAPALHDLVEEAEKRGERIMVESYIKANLLQRAHYSTINNGHFCLQVDNYAHATSPVRRYGDILNLRGVHTALQDPACGLSDKDIASINETAGNMNYLQDIGKRMDIDVLKYYAVRDLHRLDGCSLRAEIHSITPYGVHIVFPERQGLRKTLKHHELPEGWKVGRNCNFLIYKDKTRVGEGSKIRLRVGNVRPTEAEWDVYNLEPVSTRMPSKKASLSRPYTPQPV